MDRAMKWHSLEMPKPHNGLTKDAVRELKEPFDFVVVGSGYAGSLLASRLARNGCFRVLLLEAGRTPNFNAVIPLLTPMLKMTNKYTWNISTIKQRYSGFGLNDHKTKLPVAKVFGGRSILDDGVFIPENGADFDRWRRQFRLYEWGRKQMEPFLFRVQDDEVELLLNASLIDKDFSSPENLTKMITEKEEDFDHSNPLSHLWMQTGEDMGYPTLSGLDDTLFKKGAFFVPNAMTSQGIKFVPPSQFLRGIPKSKLVILTNTKVERVVFDNNKAAVEVEFTDTLRNQSASLAPRREVILSAGPIGSAQVLIQSGVGPVDHLDELGIPYVQHLPVGTQFRDRVQVTLFAKMRPLFSDAFRSKLLNMQEIETYLKNGTGMFSASGIIGAAVLRTETRYSPDLLIELRPAALLGHSELSSSLNYKTSTIHAIDPLKEIMHRGGLQITLTVLNPFSVGTMWLRPQNNGTTEGFEPVVNPSYLQDDRDLVTLVKGSQFVEAMLKNDYMKVLQAELLKPNIPSCPTPTKTTSTTTYWRCVLRYIATSGNHMTSSNALLQVVDPNLRVRGLKRLRVVDESVFPEAVSGGVPATIMAVANKAAQIILDDNKTGCRRRKYKRRPNTNKNYT